MQALGSYQTPHLVLDIDRAVEQLAIISAAFGFGSVDHAVKANPHPALLEALVRAGTDSKPVKRTSDIAAAREAGVRRFARQRDEAKVAVAAPESEVLIRIGTSGDGPTGRCPASSGVFGRSCSAENRPQPGLCVSSRAFDQDRQPGLDSCAPV